MVMAWLPPVFSSHNRGHSRLAIDPPRPIIVVEREVERGVSLLTDKVGGRARRRAVLLLGSILALASADVGAVGALAPELERSLHIGNLDVGLMVTASALTGALGMLPIGRAADRWCRSRMLVIAVAVWGLAQGLSALSVSFAMLLFARLALGALTATTGPTVASLTGDLFPTSDRSRMYGFILSGELVGAGLGLLVASSVASWTSWRIAFIVLAMPSVLLAWAIRRYLPEPARGGASRIEVGDEQLVPAEEADAVASTRTGEASVGHEPSTSPSAEGGPSVTKLVGREGSDAYTPAVLDQDPVSLSWSEAIRYVLRVRSNVMLIVASALGYFFLSGLETFALIYLRGHYGISQGVATLEVVLVGGAAVVGTVIGGRMSDTLLRRGRIDARLVVAAAGYIVVALTIAPALITSAVAVSLPLFLIAGFALAAPNPGLDAARLDVMPERMWGRAEAVRSLLRSLLQAFAPLLFGLTSVVFGGHNQSLATSARSSGSTVGAAQTAGLEPTFVIMVIPVLIAAVIVWRGRRYYPGDVAAAAKSEQRFPAEKSHVP